MTKLSAEVEQRIPELIDLRRDFHRHPELGFQEVDTGDLPDDPDTLMDAIIALDDLYKAGELPEAAYQQRRAELKEKLNQVVGKAT